MMAAPALAQPAPRQGHDPDFPCVQVLVPKLSPGQIWAGPPVDEIPAGAWNQDPDVAALVAQAADRRVPTDKLVAAMDAFAGQQGPDRDQRLTLLFAGVFDTMQGERDKAMDAIRRYSKLQRELLDRIAGNLGKLSALPEADPARAEVQESLTWDRRVLDDRRRMLATLCERPAMIERRLGAVARTLYGHLTPG
ncbi:hypothetical protein HHL28_01595 [Aerophototrophica crusticola]|uniref:Uncharacterized protein n=1 Tax=Aerophototrophica crusticola TaxID=1709002 RepID=A0A858R3M9_9PROT|nr:hypothetical protein HHL28_01595 [Rhodospirillaceae bacterium B3]